MGSRRERGRRSRFWVVVFALMLLACSAGPVLAAEPVAERAPESTNFTPPPEEETLASRVPNAQDVSKALGEYERREHEREEWLKTPEAVRQREDSRLAFVNSSPSDSEGLLRTAFPRELEVLNSDPGRFLSDAQLVASLGASGAVVRGEGETSLLETTVPLRTEDEEGRLAKVDLSLKAIPGGFETDNAIAGLRLPDSADKGVEVGEAGVEIRQAGAADSDARRYGDKNLFYHEALPDTDLLASATSFGVELYDLLRSEDSPQDLRFRIAVPDGAELRSDGRGGAEVLREGERLTLIPRPSAKDAQGTDVPIQTEVREGSLVVHVPHRTGDYTYPILVDPIAEDWVNQGKNWYGGDNWGALSNGAWKWDPESNGDYHHDICCWEGSHAGLLTIAEPVFFGPEQFGQWSYSTQNEHVYIPHIWLIPFNRADNGCGSQQPHDYAGLWNPESELWSPIWIDYAKTYGNLAGDGVGRALVIGEGSGPPGVWLACQRVLYVGGAGVWLTDDYPPIIFGVDGLPPDEWISNEDHLHIEVATGDEGLGVHAVNVNLDGGESIEDKVGGCTGLYGNRCPNNYTTAFNATGASFRQGIRTNSVSAEDPIGRGVSSQFQSKVDYSPPEVELKGQLARETNTEVELGEEQPAQDQGEEGEDELSLPVYHLNIRATDGSNASNETRQSGMRDIKLRLDSEELEVPWEEQECSQDSCEMEENYPLQLTGLKAKKHKLVVEAIDWVGKKRLREIEFEYIPATGMKDEYVMQYFPLPDGQGNEEGEEHPVRPELAVNVMNGNLVYRQRDVDVEGPAADLEVERFYNSQLPESENTEWGDGWTLAQTPKLEPEFEEPAPTSADMVQDSGAITNAVGLPPESGEEMFDPELQATITKEADGSYTVADESGETEDTLAFNSGGKVTELRTPGDAEVDYGYEGGDLAEIAVEDPGSAGAPTEPPEGEGEYEEGPAPEARPAPTYASSLGSPGSEEGQLDSPGGVAIHSSGDVWVADKGNDRIERFGPDGQFLSAFGSSGSGNGQLDEPFDLAIGGQGNLWVADHGNDRVQQFSPQGEYLGQFGSPGSEEGQLEGPEGIAIGAGGAIWVSDYSRVQKFNAQGEALALLASQGSEPGQIGNPAGLDAAEGDVWVSDWSNHRIEAFTEAGEFVRQFGSQGSGEGELEYPQDVEIDADGHAWVADQGNNRVQEFDQGGEYLAQFGAQGSGEGEFDLDFPMGIASDADGAIFVSDPGNDRVQKWTPPAANFLSSLGSPGSEEGQLDSPGGVAIHSSGDVWVADKGNDRIERFGPDGQFLSAFGSSGSGNGQLDEPFDLAIGGQGNLWVADHGNDRVQQFSPQGEYLGQFGSPGSEEGQLEGPEGIAIGAGGAIWVSDYSRVQKFNAQGEALALLASQGSEPGQIGNPAGLDAAEGDVWVSDWSNHRIEAFTEAGEFVRQFGSQGSGEGELEYPQDVEIDADGHAWVADQGNNRVQEFDQGGEYLAQFGAQGSGEGEFDLDFPMGIASDADGAIFVSDPGNDRVQKWGPPGEHLTPYTGAIFADNLGSSGSEEGQLDSPGGVAIDSSGDVWVADKGNDRIERFGPDGQFLSAFGSSGSGNGQLSSPTGLAINAQGDLWVIDAGNHRVQEFSPEGKYLTKFGSSGTGNGQFQIPRGIAIAPNGNIWVGDAEESRIQEFGPQGGYLGQIGLSGFSVRALDIDSGGRLWVGTDPGCALKLDTEGEVLASNCEVGEPAGLTADANGNIWVADQGSGKILLLGRDAEQVLQFGSEGTGEGEFEIVQPSGMAVGDANDIWIADPGNDRVQKWVAGSYVPNEEELEPDDPSVEVDVSGGLVDAVQGEKAGAHSYSHEGNDLTAYSGPEGETAYEYDTEGRMTKVTLPNGTWGEIAYFEDGRVKSVTVDPAGEEAAKTTHFEYVDNPSRSTTVVLPGTPNVTYDIGEDGSVFKWQNVQKPPTIDYIVGTLGDVENRETAEPLSSGEHRLTVQAHGDEGIVSIQVIVNNTTLVSEQTCPPEECQTLQDEWVMETANFAPGRLYIEVLVTDSEGESTSERYWVNIPQPPPPPAPGTPVPPKFRDIAKFREEYGLEVVFPVKNEIELNERIFNLIKAWHEPDTPEGEVARATMDRWGVPLRPADVAELDYRERFLAHDGPIIAQAGESNYPESYAGYYMDHRAGGKLRVGFTQDMASRVAGVAELSTLTAGDRLTPFANEPDWSLSSLYGAASEFRESVTSHQEITALLTTTGVDVKGNQLTVGATEVAPVASFIDEHFGSTTPLDAVFDPNKPEIQSDELHPRERYRNGRAFAGDHITLACTLGFGAWEEATNPGTGAPVLREFALTAGHCGEVDWENEEVGEVGEEVELWSLEPGGYHVRDPYLGHVARNAHLVNQAGAFTDLAAIRINAPSLVPRWVYWSSGSQSMINGESEYVPGGTLCRSGVSTGLRCGPAEAEPTEAWYKKDEAPYELPVWLIKVDMVAQRGDSGAPVVDPMSGSAVGIHSGGGATKPGANEYSPYSLVQPLLPLEGTDHPQISAGEAPGLGAAALSPRMHIVECCR